MRTDKVAVIGGGASGMMASIAASRNGGSVVLIEKNHTFGKKLLMTGNRRCNFTNEAGVEDFLARFGKNGKFLRNAYNSLPPDELIAFFGSRGLEYIVEDGGRVFPKEGNSSDVLELLEKEIVRQGIKTLKNTSLESLDRANEQGFRLGLSGGRVLIAGRVVLCTGGVSYPATGSSGDGFLFSGRLGHTVVTLRPALVPIKVKERFPRLLAGLSLSGVSVTIFSGARKVRKEKGDMIFTHSGLSGPVILTSSETVSGLLDRTEKLSVGLDLFPDMSREEIYLAVSARVKSSPGKSLKKCLKGFVTRRLLDFLLSEAIPGADKASDQVTREECVRIGDLCKDLRFTVAGTASMEKAMVTAGGICLKEIDPRTMSSRIVPGLYFAGEMLDVAGDTGGFNLQAAFSTGHLAGTSAANPIKRKG
jgi:predicted Rossmann fold flavoprotein